jgi:hypothetical protein
MPKNNPTASLDTLSLLLNNNIIVARKKKSIQNEEPRFCTHSPQCFISHPKPPPMGPDSLAQFELQISVMKSEKKLLEINSLVNDLLNLSLWRKLKTKWLLN